MKHWRNSNLRKRSKGRKYLIKSLRSGKVFLLGIMGNTHIRVRVEYNPPSVIYQYEDRQISWVSSEVYNLIER